MNHSMPGLPVHHQLLEFTLTHIHRVSDAIQPSHPLSSLSPPAPNPSQHQGFSNESPLCMRWPKYWSFSFSISPLNEHLGLIFFRMDWLDLLAVQGTRKAILRKKNGTGGINLPDFRLQSHSHQDSMVLAQRQKYRSMVKIESPEINPHTYGHLIFDKGGKNIQWRKDNLFNQ